MAGERRLRILAKLGTGTAPELETERLCNVCAKVCEVSGAGIMLISDDVAEDVVARRLRFDDRSGEKDPGP